MARRDEEEHPSRVFRWGATKPDGPSPEHPPGGGSFGLWLCWGRHHSRCGDAPPASPRP